MYSINKSYLEGIFNFARKEVEKQNQHYDAVALRNTEKIIAAFRKHQVSDYYMKPTNGYAYDDLGREKLDAIYADIFGTEAALVRSQFVSGTHALAVAMIGNLQAGDEVILMGRKGQEQITAEDLAKWSGTISYEILLSISDRVPRVYEE